LGFLGFVGVFVWGFWFWRVFWWGFCLFFLGPGFRVRVFGGVSGVGFVRERGGGGGGGQHKPHNTTHNTTTQHNTTTARTTRGSSS
jgi:hypothetical protein